jgi:CRISPR-associated protein (TIGR02710 family)
MKKQGTTQSPSQPPDPRPPSALVITVGIGTGSFQGPPPVIEALKRLIESQSFEAYAFLASTASKRFAEDLASLVESKGHRYTLRVIEQPDNLEECFQSAMQLLYDLEQFGFPPDRVAIDVTSGTVAMRTGTTVAGMARNVSRYNLIGGDRKDGIVLSTSMQFLSFSPEMMFAEMHLSTAEELIRQLRFTAAIHILSQHQNKRIRPSRRRAAAMSQLCRAYLAWDHFNHKLALITYKRLDTAFLPSEFVLHKASLELLTELAKRNMSPLAVSDLVANADRRVKEGRFDDAVARLYRATEYLVQLALREVAIDASNVDLNKIKSKDLRDRLGTQAIADPSEGGFKVRVALRTGFEILKDQGHKLGEWLDNDALWRSLAARNQSILAHGFTPVSETDYQNLRRQVIDLANEANPDIVRQIDTVQFPWIRN